MNMLYFQAKFLAERKGDTITLNGFASTGDIDRVKDKVLPTAFTKTLPLFMKNPVMLLQHDDDKVIWKFNEANVKSNGLEVVGEVMYDTDGCMQKIADGVLWAFSIGFFTKAYQYEDSLGHVIYKNDEGLMPGYSWDDVYSQDTIRVITELDLVEISVVATPANPYALFQVAKAFFAEETKRLKSLNRKWAPNEYGEGDEEHKETPEGEVIENAGTAPEVINPTPTGEEAPAGESPAPEEGKAPEGWENTPGESPEEKPEDTPKNVTLEDVKAIIDTAMETAVKSLSEAFEAKMQKITEDTTSLVSKVSELQEKSTAMDKEIRSIEVGPGVTKSISQGIVITDEMVMKSLRR